MTTPETKLKNDVTKYLDSIGAYHLPYFPTMYSPSGIPDRYVCLYGHHFWIEFKAEKGKLSEIQKHQIAKMAQHNILVIILYPKDIDKFKKFCENLRGDTMADPKKLTSDGLLFYYATAKKRSDEAYKELKELEEEIKRRVPLLKDRWHSGAFQMEGDVIE